MAKTSEIYALEYRFGGNAEFLTKLEQALLRMDKSFKATEVDAKKTGDGMAKAFDAADRSVQRAEKSSRNLDRALSGVDSRVSGLGPKLKGLLAGFVGFKTVGTAVSAFAERETLQTNLGVLLGDEATGRQFSDYITQFAKATPYGISELSSLANGLIQYDVPLEKVKEYMSQLGDIALGDKNKMSSLGVVLGQVASAGKLQGQDLMQFINAGWNPLNEMAKMTGKSVAELRDEMSQGAISFDMVSQAMKRATSEGGKFYRGMEKGSKTLAGRWSTAMDNIKQSLADAVEKNQDKINRLVERLGNFKLDGLVNSFARLADVAVSTGEKLLPMVEKLAEIPGLAEAIVAALAVDRLSGITSGVNMLSGGFHGLEKALRRTNRELLVMGRNGKAAAMGLAGIVGGSVAGFMGGAETSGGVVSGGLATGGAVLTATGNPMLALAATGGSFVGSLANSAYRAATYDYGADEAKAAAIEKQGKYSAMLSKAYRRAVKSGKDKDVHELNRVMSLYAKEYGDRSAREALNGLAGHREASDEAKATTVNNNVTNNNSVTQNNTIGAEFSQLGTLIRQNLVELMERNLKFDASMAMEVSAV